MPRSSNEIQKKWKEAILSQRESGLSIAGWCRKNNLSESTFYYWRDRLFPKSVNRQSFIEVKETKACDKQSGVVIEYNDFLIHLQQNFDVHVFKSCLNLLQER